MANINFSSFFTKNKGPQNQGANNSNNYQSPYFPQQVSHLQNMQTQQMNNQNVQRQPGNYPYQQVNHNNVNQQSAQRPVANNYNNQANVQQPSRPVYTPQTPVQNTGNNVVQDPNYTESSFDKELGFLNNVKRNIPVKTEEEKNEKEVNVNVSENPFVVQFPEKKEHVGSFDKENHVVKNTDSFKTNIQEKNTFSQNTEPVDNGARDFNLLKENIVHNVDQVKDEPTVEKEEKIQEEVVEKKEDFVENKEVEENIEKDFSNIDFEKEAVPEKEPIDEDNEAKEENIVEEKKNEDRSEVQADYLAKENEYLKDREVHKLENNAEIIQLEVEKIQVNPFQPRKEFNEEAIDELASSIREYGVLEPLIVRRINKDNEIEYQLIAGERRLRASKRAGLKKVPVIFKDIKNDAIVLELALIENVQREDLSSIAKAKSYARLIEEFGYTQEMVGSRVGKSRASIANTLRLLQLPYEAQKALGDGKITESHARSLLLLPNMEKQRTLLNEILTKQLSSRESHLIAKQFISGTSNNLAPKRTMRGFNQEDLELREMLETKFGTKVSIKRKGDSGEILIHFDSSDELNGIVNKITSQSKKDLDKSVQNLM